MSEVTLYLAFCMELECMVSAPHRQKPFTG